MLLRLTSFSGNNGRTGDIEGTARLRKATDCLTYSPGSTSQGVGVTYQNRPVTQSVACWRYELSRYFGIEYSHHELGKFGYLRSVPVSTDSLKLSEWTSGEDMILSMEFFLSKHPRELRRSSVFLFADLSKQPHSLSRLLKVSLR